MHLSINMEQIFPIRDEPSARLMSFKAECLLMAGVISEHEEQAVLGKAAKVLAVSDCIPAVSRHDETPAYGAVAAN
jgi:hypothetical protein